MPKPVPCCGAAHLEQDIENKVHMYAYMTGWLTC